MRQNHTTLPVIPKGTITPRWEYKQLAEDSPAAFQQRQQERVKHQVEQRQRVIKC